ncbi:hypothetical protein [Leuconostoc pseudomesenteroides]|uniref:hypothetical protein n=1 Tax=Leuconostoc pseudomesenteroides TaxID=33968 RepID=UPI0039EC47FB
MKKKSAIILSLIIILGIPEVLGMFLHKGATNGDWLQFWGTYLGIIFSVVLTLYVTNQEYQFDRENNRSNHVSEIYLSTLIEINEKMSEIMWEYSRLRNGLSFQKSNNEYYKYAQMSRAIKSIQSQDAERHRAEIFNLLAIIPIDRKYIFSQNILDWKNIYLKLSDNELPNDWSAYNDVKNEPGRDNINWFKTELDKSQVEAIGLAKDWLTNYDLIIKSVHSELNDFNYIYHK